MKSLRTESDNFLRHGQSLGYKLAHHSCYLRDFVAFMEKKHATFITNELALEWATQPKKATAHTWSIRLGLIRRFAQYRVHRDPRTEIPPTKLLSNRYWRRHPYIYSGSEIRRLLNAAKSPQKPYWGIDADTIYAALGLAAATGLRRCELINLNVDDVNFRDGTIIIKMTKFQKTRVVPHHPTVTRRLTEYRQLRDAQPNLQTTAFFISKRGERMSKSTINFAFTAACRQAGLMERPGSPNPRLHDLRHSYAVSTLAGWLRENGDIDSKIPLLSTYLGHTCPRSTYWYFSCVPEIMRLARQRMERQARVNA